MLPQGGLDLLTGVWVSAHPHFLSNAYIFYTITVFSDLTILSAQGAILAAQGAILAAQGAILAAQGATPNRASPPGINAHGDHHTEKEL